jgi:hypothetical protein
MPIYAGGLRFPSGEIGKAGRTFDTAINIEVEGFNGTLPGSLMRFHDSHQRPYLWSEKLRNTSNGQFNSIPIKLDTEPAKQDNVRVAPSNIKPSP